MIIPIRYRHNFYPMLFFTCNRQRTQLERECIDMGFISIIAMVAVFGIVLGDLEQKQPEGRREYVRTIQHLKLIK